MLAIFDGSIFNAHDFNRPIFNGKTAGRVSGGFLSPFIANRLFAVHGRRITPALIQPALAGL